MITLITMTHGNPKALQRTKDSVKAAFGDLCSDIIVGDLCIFEEDYVSGWLHERPINRLYNEGFGSYLNYLADAAPTDICLYLNVGEIINSPVNTKLITEGNYNCWQFNHATDPHKWARMYNRHDMKWSGRIHEELLGARRMCPEMIFEMADTRKDNDDMFKAWCMNDIKEMVYFKQYLVIADNEKEIGRTNAGWVLYARNNYKHLQDRLNAKGERLQRFIANDREGYIKQARVDFERSEAFKNNELIHFQ